MKRNIVIFLVLGLLAIIMVGALVFRQYADYLNQNEESYVANTGGNINNGGYVCQVGNKVYFTNFYDNGKLYVMNEDESDMKKVCDNNISKINADDKYVYYYMDSVSSLSDMGGFVTANLGIYRTSIKGDKTRMLDKVTCGNIVLVGNQLYYQRYDNEDGVGLQTYDVRSKKTSRIAQEAINPACAINGKFYYAGDVKRQGIYAMDIATGMETQLSDAKAYWVDVQGNYIYFLNIDDDYKLYRFNSSTGDMEKITDDRVDCYIISNSLIFYQKNSTTEPALIAVSLDGTNPVTLAEGNYCGFGLTSNAFYFREFGMEVPMYKVPLNGALQVQKFDAAQAAALKYVK